MLPCHIIFIKIIHHAYIYMYGNLKLTGILFKRNVIVAPGFDGGVEQFDFRMSPGSYRSRSVYRVGGECGNSAKKREDCFMSA